MKSKLFLLFAAFAVLLPVVSCNNPIEDVKRPGIITFDAALPTQAGINGLVVGSYGTLRGAFYGLRLYALGGILADENELVPSGGSGRGIDEIRNVAGEGSHFQPFTLYRNINQCNLVLENVANPTVGLPPLDVNRIRAEMLTLRAMYHFDIVRAHSYTPGAIPTSGINVGFNAGMPYLDVANDDIATAVYPARETVDATYGKIIADLQAAANLWRNGTTLRAAADRRFFVSRAATFAILSRAALYAQQWAVANQAADSAIFWATQPAGSGGLGATFTTAATLPAAWSNSAAHPESIFEVNYAIQAENRLSEGLTGIYKEGTGNNGWGDYTLSQEQYDAYARFGNGTLAYAAGAPAADIRAQVDGGLEPNQSGVEPTPLTVTLASSSTSMLIRYNRPRGGPTQFLRAINKWRTTKPQFGWHNVPLFRLTEMRLIKAEALARQGDDAGGRAELNLVRTSRGAPLYDGTGLSYVPNGQALLDAILHERRLELVAEGHRFFDLKRFGRDISKPAAFSAVSNGDRAVLAPIPPLQVTLSRVPQNRGY